jgi:hypothetical protein
LSTVNDFSFVTHTSNTDELGAKGRAQGIDRRHVPEAVPELQNISRREDSRLGRCAAGRGAPEENAGTIIMKTFFMT